MSSLSESVGLELRLAGRLDKALADAVPESLALSRSRLRTLIEAGAVEGVDGPLRDPSQKVRPGLIVTLQVPEPDDAEPEPEDIALDIVFEDAALVVVDKPAGMVVHPAPGARSGTLVNALLHHCGDTLSGIGGVRRPGIVHRIDKDTSGLLVVAKTDAAHHALAARFAKHDIDRAYLAVARGIPDRADPRLAGLFGVGFEPGGSVVIRRAIARHKTDRKRMAVVADGQGRHAVTRLRVVETLAEGRASLVECRLETGRTHQIRVHVSYLGHALLGDPVYGGRAAGLPSFGRQALHAARLGFPHPVTGKELSFTSAIPADMAQLLRKLR